MKNVVSVLEWYDKLIVDNAMNLKATLLGLCTLIIEGVELYKREVIHTEYILRLQGYVSIHQDSQLKMAS